MKIKFTKEALQKLPYTKGTARATYQDIQNSFLQLRVSKNIKAFYYYRKLKGKPIRIKLGNFPEMNPHEARRECEEKTKDIVCGSLNISKGLTFSGLFNKYYYQHSIKHKKSFKWDKRNFDYIPTLHDKKVGQITKDEIISLQGFLAENHGKYSSNRILQMIRSVYNWGINNNIIACENPVSKIKLYYEATRDRFLSPAEVKRFFEALETCDIDPGFRDFFKIAIFTGQRKGNLLSMRWKDIDFDEKIWTIPGEFFKNGDPMKAILPDQTIEILLNRIELSNESDYVFPGKDNKTHLKDPRKAWKKVKVQAELENLRIHDLRRTLGSWQAAQGSSLLVIGKSLGHKSSSATEVYARINLDPVRSSVNNAVNAMVENLKDNNISNELTSLKNKVKNLSADNIKEYKQKLRDLIDT